MVRLGVKHTCVCALYGEGSVTEGAVLFRCAGARLKGNKPAGRGLLCSAVFTKDRAKRARQASGRTQADMRTWWVERVHHCKAGNGAEREASRGRMSARARPQAPFVQPTGEMTQARLLHAPPGCSAQQAANGKIHWVAGPVLTCARPRRERDVSRGERGVGAVARKSPCGSDKWVPRST